jgi:molybdenum-dependent DNA-binding transcriptional regulator ModE
MTLNQLKYVLEISRTGSINKAASNLFLSQSVLSTSIKNLEAELGKEIFSRSTRGVVLTPFGKTFVSFISPIQMQLKQLDDMVSTKSADNLMCLSIASNGFDFISKICAALYKKYASIGIRIEEHEAFGPEAMNLVANNIAEIGLVRHWNCYKNQYTKQYNALKLQFYPLLTLDIGITVGPLNPLFYNKSNYITTDMIQPYPMIMYSYMDFGPYSDIFDRLKLKHSNSKFITSSRATIYETLSVSDACYLNSNYNSPDELRDISGSTINRRTLILQDCDIKSELGWIKSTNSNLSPIASETINLISEYLTNTIN